MLKVEVKKGNIERALKELKGKFIKTKVPKECRNRQEYTKKSVTKRSEKLKAIYLQKKYNEKTSTNSQQTPKVETKSDAIHTLDD